MTLAASPAVTVGRFAPDSSPLVVASIVDTGFLVALLDASDPHHAWSVRTAARASGPWLTVEACITESLHCLSRRALPARTRLFGWLERGLLLSSHALPERHSEVWTELTRYHGRSVDFADACLTVLSDLHPSLTLVTTDRRDFSVYLRGRSPRLLLTPASWQP